MAVVDPPTKKQIAEEEKLDRLSEQAQASYDDWYKRWVFMLSIGNGAAMLAIAGSVLEKPENKFLLVSAWLFLIGLVCAGFAPFVIARAYHEQASYLFGKARLIFSNPLSPMTENNITASLKTWTDESKVKRGKLLRLVEVLVFSSCASFLLGCIWGLLHLGHRL